MLALCLPTEACISWWKFRVSHYIIIMPSTISVMLTTEREDGVLTYKALLDSPDSDIQGT